MKSPLIARIVFDNVHKDLVLAITIKVNMFVGITKITCKTLMTH